MPCVIGILQLWIGKAKAFTCSSGSKPWMLAWELGSWAGQLRVGWGRAARSALPLSSSWAALLTSLSLQSRHCAAQLKHWAHSPLSQVLQWAVQGLSLSGLALYFPYQGQWRAGLTPSYSRWQEGWGHHLQTHPLMLCHSAAAVLGVLYLAWAVQKRWSWWRGCRRACPTIHVFWGGMDIGVMLLPDPCLHPPPSHHLRQLGEPTQSMSCLLSCSVLVLGL